MGCTYVLERDAREIILKHLLAVLLKLVCKLVDPLNRVILTDPLRL